MDSTEILIKKKKSLLINALVINWFILIIFLIFIFVYVKPWFSEVKQNKEILLSDLSTYENIKKNGVDYQTLKTLVPATDKDLKNIIENMWWDFFKTSLTNKTAWDYLTFLDKKEDYVNDLKKEDFLKNRDNKVSDVLPFYTDWEEMEWSITELWFLNYVESLLRTFSLKTSSQIWVWNLIPVNESAQANKEWLSSQIFYTDLQLNLEWKRSDILDFLYFAQNVWNVSIETKKDKQDITFYKDSVLNKKFSWTKKDNIYENRIMDIVSIGMSDYIDASTTLRTQWQKSIEWFISFIKNSPESADAFSVEVTLRFYLRWLPTYKIQIFVQSVLDQYDSLLKDVKKTLWTAQNKSLVKSNTQLLSVSNSLKSLDTYFTDSANKIKELRMQFMKKQNLDTIYYQASDLKYELDSISTMLEKNKQELQKTLNNK